MSPLNHKQRAFAAFYTTLGPTFGNAAASARAAGYSERTVETCGPRLLRNAQVKALVEELGAKAEKKLEKKLSRTQDDILEELARLGFSDITDIYNDETCTECGCSRGTLKHPKDMPVEVRRAIKSIEFEELCDGNHSDSMDGEDKGRFVAGRVVKMVLHSKEKGLELLGKNLKLFTDKVDLHATGTIAIINPYAEPQNPEKKS